MDLSSFLTGWFDFVIKIIKGHIDPFSPPFTNAAELTHMFTESRYLGKEKVFFLTSFPFFVLFPPLDLKSLSLKVDYSGLAMRGVPVLKPLFLNDFLTSISGRPPPFDNHMLEDAKPHWDKMKRKRVVTDTPTNDKKKGRPSIDL